MGQRQALAPPVPAGPLHPLASRPGPDPSSSPLGVLAGAGPDAREVGLYLHVPFCARRCHYCSFNTAPLDGAAMARYLRAVAREIDLLAGAPWAPGLRLASIFLGGGTPSLLPPAAMAALLDGVRRAFLLAAGAEVTVECNPESVSRDLLRDYRAAGVTRISLGVQSLDDDVLGRLGRLHSSDSARAAFAAARQAGFDNISVDLMYGVPGLDLPGWARGVGAILNWEPEHLSAYGLTLDEGSLWGAAGVADLPAEETVVAQYWALVEAAAGRGYEHYEISNYARPGRRCRHNMTYWQAAEYLGCGPGASGFIGDVRYTNARAVPRYAGALDERRLPIESWEQLTARQRLAERLILGLRTVDGIPAAWLAERTAVEPALRSRLDRWRERRLLADAGSRVRLTEAGFLLSDALFVHLL